MKKLLNVEYSCIHGTYWMFYGVVSSFASVFLLAKGFSNWNIGVTLAVANVLAVILQPVVADVADRAKKLSVI
ncbi:MAG: MFS transporter, partial [Bacillota bacterium]|nr:MFS transporter [Bacillota bacterium]